MKQKIALILAVVIVLTAAGLAAQEAPPAVKLITDVNALFEKMSRTMVSEQEGAAVLDTAMEAASGTAMPGPGGIPATSPILVLDEVKPGSLGEWKERFDPKSITPQFGCEEFTSPYDRSTALRTWAKGNTYATCETKWIRRVYATGPQRTDGTVVEAFLAFTFDGTTYNLPSVKLELLDERGQVVAGQVYFGKGIIGSFNRGQLSNTGYRELPSASGLQRFDLAREFGSGRRFSALAVSLMNYACQGENSVVFDHFVLHPGPVWSAAVTMASHKDTDVTIPDQSKTDTPADDTDGQLSSESLLQALKKAFSLADPERILALVHPTKREMYSVMFQRHQNELKKVTAYLEGARLAANKNESVEYETTAQGQRFILTFIKKDQKWYLWEF
jgi:hypothetical protein